MSTVMNNSAIAAKLACMRSKMLSIDDYKQMSALSSVSQVAGFLKNNTAYASVLENVSDTSMHREELEMILKTALIDDFKKVFCFADNNMKFFLEKTLMSYEIDAIIKVAHTISTKRHTSEMLGEFLKKHIDIDLDELSKVTTLEQFANALNNTQYYKAFSSIMKSRDGMNVFDIETALNIYGYASVMKYVSALPDSEKAVTEAFYGAVVDLNNLRIIYRLKGNFKIPAELIYSYVIPYNYKLKKDEIKEIVETDDFELLMSAISKTYYGKLFENGNYERNIDKYIYEISKKYMRLYPGSYVSIACYFKMRETEIKNIFSVIEGIRYSLSPKEIIDYIIV